MTQPADRLPPHSPEAEQGVLGCVLLDPTLLPGVLERFQGEAVFYDLRHAHMFLAMESVHHSGKQVDLISLFQSLKDSGRLGSVGGMEYLTAVADSVPTPLNLPTYTAILWEKFLARQAVQMGAQIVSEVYSKDGLNEPLIEKIKSLHLAFEAKSQRGSIHPEFIKPATDFADECMAHFFGGLEDVPGLDLPVGFPLKIRLGETTILSGDDGAGKSTILYYIASHLAHQGEKVCVASLEMPPAVSLWIMASQLMGCKKLPDSEAGRARAAAAIAWLNSRVVFYDFVGIGDWRNILDSFRYARRKLGCTVFILDSVMRIGIPDDDYGMQSTAAAVFASFAVDEKSHLFYVVHENKGDGKGKQRIRGSKLWSANAFNVLWVGINADKEQRAGKVRWQLEQERKKSNPKAEIIASLDEELGELRQEWDTNLVMHKQRYPGTRQNASAYLWFDPDCFQVRSRFIDPATDWVSRWRKTRPATISQEPQ